MEGLPRFTAGTYLTSPFIVIFLIIFTSVADEHPKKSKEISITIQEMQHANYFTFAMLINMVADRIPINTTFLMPMDQMLSEISITEIQVFPFLSRHSIPSALLFDDLKHLPTGTTIPTHQSGYKLSIVNEGGKRYYLNKLQVVSINICTSGSSFRCHGISGVLDTQMQNSSQSVCNHSTLQEPPKPYPAPSQQLPPAMVASPPSSVVTPTSPSPGDSSDQTSASTLCNLSHDKLIVVETLLILSLMSF